MLFYSVLLGLSIMMMIHLKTCNSLDQGGNIVDFPQIVESGEIIVTTDYNKVGYYFEGDTIHGLQYELIQAFAQEHGLTVQIIPIMPLSSALRGLEQGNYHIVTRSIPVTSELREFYNFTEPIVRTKQVLVQRIPTEAIDSPLLRNQLSLGNQTLHISHGSPSRLRIENLSQEIGDSIYINEWYELNDESLLKMVSEGQIKYAVCDAIVCKRLSSLYTNIDYQTAISFTQLQSWAVNKKSPMLLDSLNAWIIRYKVTGQFDKIVRKYQKSL